MHQLPGKCPVCGGEMLVTKLECRECETTIEGRFFGTPFAELSAEHLEFIELFVKNEGKINRMEVDMGLSYPTIRNKLHDVIRALGYEPGKTDMLGLTDEERRKILEDLNQGRITSEEAMRMLQE